jgi:hypothetical protein
MLIDRRSAGTGRGPQRELVFDDKRTAFCADDARAAEAIDDPGDEGTADAQKHRQFVLGHVEFTKLRARIRCKQPFCDPLADRMRRVAGGGLEHLREQTIGIARKPMAQEDGIDLGFLLCRRFDL